MRDPGRVAAAIDILTAFNERPAPLSVLVSDWGRRSRFAGSKDRAFIRGLALDGLRRWRSFGGHQSPRQAIYLTLREVWKWELTRVDAAFAGDHGPGWLTTEEQAAKVLDVPDLPAFTEALFPDRDAHVLQSLTERAPVDLRANSLKASQEKALKACASLGAQTAPLSPVGLRIPPPPSAEKGPGVTVIPAYGKGWVEVQDEGSQLTVLAVGPLDGAQVLDFCAGGGGKSLALAAQMGNTGQIHAYDASPERLAPIHERLRRSGARNVQVVAPSDKERLEILAGRMDLVFVDAPCSGSGTWRRHPDAKWRLTPEHLQARQNEQDAVLDQAAQYVRPGGTLFYVTCSLFTHENQERVESFLTRTQDFTIDDPLAGLVEGDLKTSLTAFRHNHALRLTPWASNTDGFTVMRLLRKAR